MDELIKLLVSNIPNFAGFVLLYYALDKQIKACQQTNDKLIDFLIATRGLEPHEVREQVLNQ